MQLTLNTPSCRQRGPDDTLVSTLGERRRHGVRSLHLLSLSLSSPAEFEFLVEASSGSHQTLDSSVLVGFAERKTHIKHFHICSKLLCVCVSVCVSVSRLTSVCGSQR